MFVCVLLNLNLSVWKLWVETVPALGPMHGCAWIGSVASTWAPVKLEPIRHRLFSIHVSHSIALTSSSASCCGSPFWCISVWRASLLLLLTDTENFELVLTSAIHYDLLIVHAIVNLSCSSLIVHVSGSRFRCDQYALFGHWLHTVVHRCIHVTLLSLILLRICHRQVKSIFEFGSVWVIVKVDGCDSFVASARGVIMVRCWPFNLGSTSPASATSCKFSDWDVTAAYHTVARLVLCQIDTEIVEIATCRIHVSRSDTRLRDTCHGISHVLGAKKYTLLWILILALNLVHRGICVSIGNVMIGLPPFVYQAICNGFYTGCIRAVWHKFLTLATLSHPLVFLLFLALCVIVRYVEFLFIFDDGGSIWVDFW